MEHFEFFVFNASGSNNNIRESLNIFIIWIVVSGFTFGNTYKLFNIDICLFVLKFRVENVLKDLLIALEWVNLLIKWIKLIRTILFSGEILESLNSQFINCRVDFLLRSLIRNRSLHLSFLYGEHMIISIESTQLIELSGSHLIVGISWKNCYIQTEFVFDRFINTVCIQNLSHLLRCQDILFNDCFSVLSVHLRSIIHFIRTQKKYF